jgi:hypothetical protein
MERQGQKLAGSEIGPVFFLSKLKMSAISFES